MAETGYLPGVCNIGSQERRVRLMSGLLSLAVTVGGFVALRLAEAAPSLYFALGAPAAAAALGFLQAGARFCVGFGMRGVFNFGAIGEVDDAVGDEARLKDRARARWIMAEALVIGAVAAVVANRLAAVLA